MSVSKTPVQIQDANGNTITATGNALDVNIKSGAASGTQYAEGTTQATATGTVALGKNPSNVVKPLALDASGNLNVNLAAGTISGGNSAASATGAAVPASADYTGFNSGGNLVGVSTANPLPVAQQGTVTTNATLQASSAVIGHVIVDTAPTTAVTNAGTFPVQATLAAETTKVIGTVNVSSGQSIGVSSLPTLPAGTNAIGTVGVTSLPAFPTGANTIGYVSAPLPGSDLSANYLSNLLQQEVQQEILLELRAIRLALIALATEGGRNQPEDFNPLAAVEFSSLGNIK